jgi:hypothetical protein
MNKQSVDNYFYVYQYLDKLGIPYYVGKGCGRRIHFRHANVDLPPIERRIIIKDGLTNNEAKFLEKELIIKYGRKLEGGILDNIKINQWACYTGWKHSEQTKQKISLANTGKKRTAEQLKNYKGTKTAEHAEKIRQANLGRPNDGRYVKIGLTKSKHRWYTNGTTTIMVVPGTQPEGYVPGRKLNG